MQTLNLERRTSNTEQDRCEPRPEGQPQTVARKYDLEERLLEFASIIIDVSEKLPNTRAGNHLAGQLLRAGTSPYGNHGEAQAPESADDFIHKMKVCLKELRETRRWLRLIERKSWLRLDPQLVFLLREGEELIRIFKASVQTAEKNKLTGKRNSSSSPSRGT